jgi:hypothetical protein
MSDWDVTPRAARRLRTFGRLDAPAEGDVILTPAVPDPTGPAGDAQRHAAEEARSHTSIRDRRRHHKPDPDAVHIDLETSHAWWAQRDDLELLVNPKKQGAAARAKRAAEAAFAPPNTSSGSARSGPTSPPPQPGGAGWDPSQVYSWAPDPGVDTHRIPDPEPPAPSATTTPWDVLGLTSDATWGEVARRHKQLAKQHHPDRHGTDDLRARNDAETRMSGINAAFSDLRRIYRITGGI